MSAPRCVSLIVLCLAVLAVAVQSASLVKRSYGYGPEEAGEEYYKGRVEGYEKKPSKLLISCFPHSKEYFAKEFKLPYDAIKYEAYKPKYQYQYQRASYYGGAPPPPPPPPPAPRPNYAYGAAPPPPAYPYGHGPAQFGYAPAAPAPPPPPQPKY